MLILTHVGSRVRLMSRVCRCFEGVASVLSQSTFTMMAQKLGRPSSGCLQEIIQGLRRCCCQYHRHCPALTWCTSSASLL